MSRRKLSNKSSQIISLCSVANFISAADRVIMPIAIIPMAEKYKWSLTLWGWILSSFAFGYCTNQIVGDCAAERIGGKMVLFFAATIPGILCGPSTAKLVTASLRRFPAFLLAAAVNFTGAVIYYSQSSASQVLRYQMN